ncbi:hypothetical protein QOZ96_001504 [Brevundimonas nasdae]|uniref:hypothetical protein n=1 Tax=Brevundimonas nasdae TaxID=172043 RepID=UPI001912ABDF|nr:hypothetical protein [Brevundimonas nasdae]MBK6025108.1 hypothetical protein [Brevundimonas nasdae]MDQ0451557.1 hypothetical protein [Brevundimonas nasdae]
MLNMLYAQVGAVFVVLICAFALLKGDEPERFGAGAYCLLWIATILIQTYLDANWTNYGVFALDVLFLCLLCSLAWKARRSWPVWAAGLQLLSVMSHLLLLVDARMPSASLYTVLNLTGYGVLICLAVGTFWAWQERKASRGIE